MNNEKRKAYRPIFSLVGLCARANIISFFIKAWNLGELATHLTRKKGKLKGKEENKIRN